MSRHRIEDGGNSPADIIKRIERARRADSTREGLASAYRRLDEALTKATDKMCEIGLLPASTAPARASPAPTGDSTRRASALAAAITTSKTTASRALAQTLTRVERDWPAEDVTQEMRVIV